MFLLKKNRKIRLETKTRDIIFVKFGFFLQRNKLSKKCIPTSLLSNKLKQIWTLISLFLSAHKISKYLRSSELFQEIPDPLNLITVCNQIMYRMRIIP